MRGGRGSPTYPWPRFGRSCSPIRCTSSSSGARCRKPEPACFERVLEAEGARAAAVTFVDDLPANVAAARALGLRGIVHRSAGQLEERLRQGD